MMNAEDRKFLQTEMDKFLSGEEYAQAEGYVPPKNKAFHAVKVVSVGNNSNF